MPMIHSGKFVPTIHSGNIKNGCILCVFLFGNSTKNVFFPSVGIKQNVVVFAGQGKYLS